VVEQGRVRPVVIPRVEDALPDRLEHRVFRFFFPPGAAV
jgi:hypothetical protein